MTSTKLLRLGRISDRFEISIPHLQRASRVLRRPCVSVSQRSCNHAVRPRTETASNHGPQIIPRRCNPLRTLSVRHASSSTTSPPPEAPSSSSSTSASSTPAELTQDLTEGLSDQPLVLDEGSRQVDWARSFHGLGAEPFSKEAADVLTEPITFDDVEIKPDGIIYLPEIKYRRILNRAFGPGAWGLAPRGETIVTSKAVTREYALVAHGRLVSVARGEQDYFSPEGIPTAVEGCKSNAMMRCCKDLGVASELWDPRYIRKFIAEHGKEVFVEHATTKRRRKIWLRKDESAKYPYKETKGFGST
ncbi:MAG: hypothetical protein M1837_003646 [Sclerophora amabilis]|nr:MAG: hypothetical protein M1837_003646 [Sclerophora amabilis]